MFTEFVKTLAVYMEALEKVQESVDEKEGLTPYLGRVEVMLDGQLVGHLIDEGDIGFRYEEVEP